MRSYHCGFLPPWILEAVIPDPRFMLFVHCLYRLLTLKGVHAEGLQQRQKKVALLSIRHKWMISSPLYKGKRVSVLRDLRDMRGDEGSEKQALCEPDKTNETYRVAVVRKAVKPAAADHP